MDWKNKIANKAFRWSPKLFAEELLPYSLHEPQAKVLDKLKYEEEDKVVISAAAGVGKTLGMAIFAIWACTALSNYKEQPIQVEILGGSGKQSKILYRYIKKFISYSDWIEEQVEGDPKRSETKFKNGSWVSAMKASQKQVRGEHPDIAIIDEAVEVDKELIEAVLPRVSPTTFPKRILCSTPHDYNSFFVDLWENAEDKGYNKYQWSKYDVKEMDFVSEDELEDGKNMHDEATYKQEYLGKPVPITDTIIQRDDLKSAIVRKEEGKPSIEAFTTMGIDWGFDHPTAYVVIQRQENYLKIIESSEWRQQKFEWMHNQLNKVYNDYEVDLVHADNEDQGENQRLRKEGMTISPIAFTGQMKKQLVNDMKRAFEQGKVLIPSSQNELIKELKKYTYGTRKGDDLVDALMLALHAERENVQAGSSNSGKMYHMS